MALNLKSKNLISCKDCFRMNVMDSESHYSSQAGPESEETYEVGYPSQPEVLLMPYEVWPHIYGFVPLSVIEKIVIKHGGLEN